jgi:hypothetical protein
MGVWGSSAPWKSISRPPGSNTRRTTNRSASVVLDETNSLAALGPVISVSRSSGAVRNVTPSPLASYAIEPEPAGSGESLFASASR